MKYGTLISVYLALLILIAPAQDDPERTKRTAEVESAIDKTVADGKLHVKGVRYDVRIFEGKIVFADDEGFGITPEKGIQKGKLVRINYRDVIELETKDTLLSYFPDPDRKPFGEWAAVKKLVHGDSLDIDLVSREQLFGVLLKTSDLDLTVMQGNEILVIKRENVSRILLARRDMPEAKKILKGAGKGAAAAGKGGGGGGGSIGEAVVYGAVLVGATAAGAINAAAKRFPNDRLLIYAK